MTKTCGECKYYLAEFYHCQKHDVMAEPHNTCEDCTAKTITNRDVINAMSDEGLAELLVYTIKIAGGLKFMYSSRLIDKCYHRRANAVKATVAKLKEVAE